MTYRCSKGWQLEIRPGTKVRDGQRVGQVAAVVRGKALVIWERHTHGWNLVRRLRPVAF